MIQTASVQSAVLLISAAILCVSSPDALAAAALTGEMQQWHKITLTIDGPAARETDVSPNPFLDYRMLVTFAHESGALTYRVPGYFAADGNAGETGATSGDQWRAHVSPDKAGDWTYEVSFQRGREIAIDPTTRGEPVLRADGMKGAFTVTRNDKTGRDFRAQGRLQYVGARYLRFAGSGEYFLKAGADAPETLLAYADFDGTRSVPRTSPKGEKAPALPLKTWAPHLQDWRAGDPTWGAGRGKGLIGALNYLAGTGANAVSFLTYNAGGDGDNVWPFIDRDDPRHYDCSKLDQWQVVFAHAQRLGLYLHFKLQENENDDDMLDDKPVAVPTSLDGGELGVERRLYLRELIARFGHELALNWNLGEENTQTTEQQRAMADFIRELDAYDHHIVLHTWPGKQETIYRPLLGERSALTGVSLQTSWDTSHQMVLQWVGESTRAVKPWVVAHDEQNPHYTGVPPDPGYEGFDGTARPKEGSRPYTIHDIRKYTLWGTLMAGGAGVEYYFGYTLPQDDLRAEDWRSRDQSWRWGAIALQFFRQHAIPLWEMHNADELVGNSAYDNSKYCLARAGDIYVVYLPDGETSDLNLGGSDAAYSVQWFDPRNGGPLKSGPIREVRGPGRVGLGSPPAQAGEDWVVLVRRKP
jgi:hypothetical protein